MNATLALRNLVHRPGRTLFLLFGYGLGVGVMIVLLAIGEALLTQARDVRLVGGGQITVLPAGVNIEMLKTGGIGGMYFSIANARFIDLQLLAAPRLAPQVATVAPQIAGKLLYLRTPRGEFAVRASGDIPSRSAAVGGLPPVVAGRWADDALDSAWADPTPLELYGAIDHFHLPPRGVAHPSSWGEWHYFNVLSADHRRWAFISYLVGGDVRGTKWGGRVAITLRRQGGPSRRFAATVPASGVRFSTTSPDLSIGEASVRLLPDGRYALHARTAEEGSGTPLALDLVVTPAPRAYFPGATLASGRFSSGYTVPALRASATGTICVRDRCRRYADAQAYHDHNWGVWRGVTWEWGAARAGRYTFLYGRVQPPDSIAARAPFFFYLIDPLGFLALFRPRQIEYVDHRTITVGGQPVRVPSRALIADARGDDTLRVELTIEDAIGTDTRGPLIARGDVSGARALGRPYFIQMKGRARLSGRVQGKPLAGSGEGFFETYR